jgi:hypothetical protein
MTDPDPFLIAIAELAGLNPDQVIAGTMSVQFDRVDVPNPGDDPESFADAAQPTERKTVAHVRAEVLIPVDAEEVIRHALEHDRISLAGEPGITEEPIKPIARPPRPPARPRPLPNPVEPD